MNKLILATGSNLNYLDKISIYLLSILEHSNFDANYLMFLGDHEIPLQSKKIRVLKINVKEVACLNSVFCLQHGEFLKSKELKNETNDNDIIFFTDGDMTLQRPMSEDEIEKFRNFKDNDVYVGYNESPSDTLYNESIRLGIKKHSKRFLEADIKNIKIYNTGVLAMNKKTWLKLMQEYIINYPEIDNTLHHYAKQQWLISFIIGTQDYNIIEMGYDIHNHTHYPSPKGTAMDKNGIVTYNNKIVLFKHKWE